MARRDEGAYSREICNRGETKPAAPPRRKTARDIFKTRSKGISIRAEFPTEEMLQIIPVRSPNDARSFVILMKCTETC
jgi:hypothetical protein